MNKMMSMPVDAGGYLFVTFQGEATPMSEQVYFVISEDGLSWQALNAGRPVLVSEVGEKGARDPFLVRLQDDRGFVLLATDLSAHHNRNWTRNAEAGSRSILIWESVDLVHWSPPRLVPVGPEDAGCAWAPEAIYDANAGDYLVFWASTTRRDPVAKQRIWARRTRDFRTFGEPFVFIDKPHHVIDTDIARDGKVYYRFSKDDAFKTITMESSPDLMGPWQAVSGFTLGARLGYEGPLCFALAPATAAAGGAWCLLIDHYAEQKGYEAFVCHDLARGDFVPAAELRFPLKMRHGGVLPITAAERKRLVQAYGGPKYGENPG